ncbi:MAG: DUF4249 domain-containing protein [Tannerellaceae bacterium]|jgi:hypothetical protein|nr:DUF4249 domain-containing protein [Tannerellaceae bacterium]
MELQVLTPFRRLACILLTAALAQSCEERITIDTGTSEPRLVIYGYITTDSLRHAVSITRSSGYFSTTKPEGITGAEVVIRQGEEAYILTESGSEPGLYQTADSVAGEVGKTYTLHVSLDFDGDGQAEEYGAESWLPPVSRLDSMAVRPSALSDHHMEVLIWGRLPEEEENYFNFRLYRNGVLVNDSLRGFRISDDLFLGRKDIEGTPVFYLNQRRESEQLSPGDSLTFQIDGITSEYAGFINNAQSERRGSIPLFGAPPANIETNLRRLTPGSGAGLSGFFTAFSVSRAGMLYPPE